MGTDHAAALRHPGVAAGGGGATGYSHPGAGPAAPVSPAAFEARKQAVARLLADGAGEAAKRANKALGESLEAAREHLAAGVMSVLVCGEFKRGKSKLINALLEDPGLVPVDVDIATNAVSVIAYGEQERILAYLEQNGDEPRPISRAELPDYVVESRNPGNRAGTRLVTIEVPNAKLRAGLGLVDTPGVGGLNKAHNAATYSFLPNADAVLFVGDVVTPLSSEELEFAKLAAERCEAVVFVLTKADLEHDAETIVENTRRKLADVLGRPGEALSIVPVSSELKLRWLESGDDADLADSNFVELERILWGELAARGGEILLARALSELQRAMTALALPLRTAQQACGAGSKEEVERLEQDLEQLEERLKELTGQGADWRLKLSRGLDDIRSDLMAEADGKFRRLRDIVQNDYLADDKLVMDPDRIGQRLNKEIALLIGDLGKQFDRRAATLVEEVRGATGLRLGDYPGTDAVGGLPGQLGELRGTIKVNFKRTPKGWETLRAYTFSSIPGATIGGFLGGLAGAMFGVGVGAALGAPAGAAVGGLVTSIFGAQRHFRQLKKADVANMRFQLLTATRQRIDEAQAQSYNALQRAVRDFDRFAVDEFTGQLKMELEAVTASRRALGEAISRSQQDALRAQAEIEAELAPIDQILDRVGQLREQPADGGTSQAQAGERLDLEG